MTAVTDSEVSQAATLLAQLLEEAQNPTSQEAGPVVLQKCKFDISKVTDIRVITPNEDYCKMGADGNRSDSYEHGHDVIQRLITDGYKIITVVIVRAFSFAASTKHEVKVILVKLET